MKKVKSRQKRLLIGNSDRYYNFSLISDTIFDDVKRVTSQNKDEIDKEFKERVKHNQHTDPLGLHSRDDNIYRVYSSAEISNELLGNIIHYGKKIDYISNKVVPAEILNRLALAKNREIIYEYETLSEGQDLIDNINKAHQATITSVYVELDPTSNIYDLLFKLYPVRTNVDNVYIRFKKFQQVDPDLRDKFNYLNGYWDIRPEYKFNIFKLIQTTLSTWAMNIHFITGKDILDLRTMAIEDRKRGKKPKLIEKR